MAALVEAHHPLLPAGNVRVFADGGRRWVTCSVGLVAHPGKNRTPTGESRIR